MVLFACCLATGGMAGHNARNLGVDRISHPLVHSLYQDSSIRRASPWDEVCGTQGRL